MAGSALYWPSFQDAIRAIEASAALEAAQTQERQAQARLEEARIVIEAIRPKKEEE